MLMEGKRSRLNNNNNNNTEDFVVDRISDLPDSILGQILSFLPTDSAVATSILSKRWEFAWVTVHSLDFSNREKEDEEEYMEFVRFVDRVLLLNDVGWLNKFSLCCRIRQRSLSVSPQIISWINAVITRNVHELYLSVVYVDLPSSIFSCESLRSLELLGSISFRIDDTTVFRLPRLKSMKIRRVSFESEEVWQKLISGCPVLDYLTLYMCDYRDRDFTCILSSPSLKHLELFFDYTTKLKLKASSLEYLRLFGPISEIFVEKCLRSLVRADIDIQLDKHDFPDNSIVEVLRAMDCAKFLTLSGDVMQALSRATISLSAKFKNLLKLEAKGYFSSLLDVIQSSDNLEDLKILQYPNNSLQSEWTTPLEVPRCFTNSLKNVQLKCCKGLEDKREIICYVLKYGSALEVLQIFCYVEEYGEKLELFQEICEFPRKSPACKVQFSVCSSKRPLEPLVLISGQAGEMVYLP